MVTRRSAFALTLAASIAFSASAFAQKDKKQDEAQKKEIQAVVKIVDAAAAGGALADDLGLAWAHDDVMKAQGNKQYVPFIVKADASKVAGSNVAMYWRVVSQNPAPVDPKAKDKKKNDYAYEDVTFQAITAGQPLQIARSFTVAAGTYDVFVVVKEPVPSQKNAPAPKMSVMKHTIVVPDFWNGELSTSSVIVAGKIEPLPAPLTPQQQADRPYAMGAMEITPVIDMKMPKKAELSTFMLIYNPKVDSANKPDVTVEYNFCQKAEGSTPKEGEACKAGEKFFNKTNPQNLNAQTLPPQFDLAAGHQLQTGQAVPLATFPEGSYRLEIKVTDKIGKTTLTRDLNFSVSGS